MKERKEERKDENQETINNIKEYSKKGNFLILYLHMPLYPKKEIILMKRWRSNVRQRLSVARDRK